MPVFSRKERVFHDEKMNVVPVLREGWIGGIGNMTVRVFSVAVSRGLLVVRSIKIHSQVTNQGHTGNDRKLKSVFRLVM